MYDTYVSIDLETTGLNPKRDRIIEIGAIRVEQGQIVEEFSTFVDPGRKLEERITELTGIRDEDLADAPQLDAFSRCNHVSRKRMWYVLWSQEMCVDII